MNPGLIISVDSPRSCKILVAIFGLINVQPHDDITKYYYTTTFMTNNFMFFKRYSKDTLALNFAKTLLVEKDMRSIGVIVDFDDSKDSKDVGNKTEASSIKTKEKDYFDMESLAKSLKILNNELSKLKRNSSEASTRSKIFKLFFL